MEQFLLISAVAIGLAFVIRGVMILCTLDR